MILSAIDIGGTAIKYGVVSCSGNRYEFLEKGSFATPYQGAGYLIHQLSQRIQKASQHYKIDGIAVSTPGGVSGDPDGIVYRGGKLRYLDQIPLGKLLRQSTGLSCSVENDGRCGVMGEYTAGALQGCSSGATIVLGTSVGGGIILEGNVLRGANDFAGKFAHILTTSSSQESEYSCFGAENGCSALKQLVLANKHLPADQELNGYQIFDLIEKGDPDAVRALQEFCRRLAFQITNLQIILDLEIVAIAGGISSRTVLLDYIEEQLEQIYRSAPFARPHSKVCLAKLGNDANLVGACLAWQNMYLREKTV